MAKLTKEQAIKWDKMLSNDYHFDVKDYVIWGDKHASLKIELAEDKILEAALMYREEGVGFRATGRQIPHIHLQLWQVNLETGVGVSHGLGAYIPVGEIQNNRNWKYLCALSREYPADRIMKLAKDHAPSLSAETLLESIEAMRKGA